MKTIVRKTCIHHFTEPVRSYGALKVLFKCKNCHKHKVLKKGTPEYESAT